MQTDIDRPVLGNLHGEDRRQILHDDAASCDADQQEETFLVQAKLPNIVQNVVKFHLVW